MGCGGHMGLSCNWGLKGCPLKSGLQGKSFQQAADRLWWWVQPPEVLGTTLKCLSG